MLTNIENGERNIKEEELDTICDIFEVPRSYFDESAKEKFQELDKNEQLYNFKRILLYILQKCGHKPNL